MSSPEWLNRLADVHCHPHDEPQYDPDVASNADIQVSKVLFHPNNF